MRLMIWPFASSGRWCSRSCADVIHLATSILKYSSYRVDGINDEEEDTCDTLMNRQSGASVRSS